MSICDAMLVDASDLLQLDVTELVSAVKTRKVSVKALVNACLSRIAERDEELKAFITVCSERARAEALVADRALARGEPCGALHGIPVAIKDNTLTAGIRTTFGSRIRADYVPDTDDLVVARFKQAGAIIVGKTNTPEFACGALCTNALQGPTANPWNTSYSSGGSSGGSAASVADRMVPLAQGTDFGGSVRTPASFCGVFGLRPTPGRIPLVPKEAPWNALNAQGILARTVRDAALALEVLSGPDLRDPLSAGVPAWKMGSSAVNSGREMRIAYSADLGFATVHKAVRSVFETAVERMLDAGLCLSRDAPDTTGAQHAFETIRAANLHQTYARLCREHRALCSPSFVWNVERGAAMRADTYLASETERGRVYQAFTRFFKHHDILITVSATVPPFPNSQEDVLEIDGIPMENIIDYLRITYVVSLVGFPALSIPCGFTDDGLPVGLQLIARPFEETALLEFAALLERELGFAYRPPPYRSNPIPN